jgi:hypothetical protein
MNKKENSNKLKKYEDMIISGLSDYKLEKYYPIIKWTFLSLIIIYFLILIIKIIL